MKDSVWSYHNDVLPCVLFYVLSISHYACYGKPQLNEFQQTVFIKNISSYLYSPKVDNLFRDSILAVNIYMPISKH